MFCFEVSLDCCGIFVAWLCCLHVCRFCGDFVFGYLVSEALCLFACGLRMMECGL